MREPSKSRRAFSLIEILVAILIVAILAVVLSAFASRSIARAQSAACALRLKSLGAGLQLYTAENNGVLPSCALPGTPITWFDMLAPYMGESEKDVASTETPKWLMCPARKFEYTSKFTTAYGWNFAYFGYQIPDPPWATGSQSRMSEVERPSQTIILGDSHDKPIQVLNDELMSLLIYPPDNSWEQIAQRHQGKGNYLFLDGHVAAYSPKELSDNSSLFMKIKP